jgi:predicted MPP superfamily phosphohydrolase
MSLIILLISLCAIGFVYARFVEPNLLVVRRLRLRRKASAGGGSPLRITLISDFHYPRYSDYRMVRRAIEASNALDPDVVFLLGDFFDKNRKDPAVLPENIGALFGGIRSRLGVFGVLGNHDHWFDERAIRNALGAETNILLVDNASALIEASETPLYVVGVGDLWCKNARYDQAVSEVPGNASIILLSHNPDVIAQIRDPRILVQFSGHTHGGQVRLPFVGALRVPSEFGNRYASGLVTGEGHHPLYVNSGICSMKGIRFLCPPEVTSVEIDR